MKYTARVLKLHFSNRQYALLVPVYTMLAMAGFSIIIALLIGINTGLPLPEDAQDGFGNNSAAMWAIPGFLVSLGVLTVNRNFAMALAFGSTRKHFWVGTAIGFTVTALIAAAAGVILLWVELATNHWFVGARAFDVVVFGSGDALLTFCALFVLAILSMFVGALFGTVYRAFGVKWTTILGIGIGVLALGASALLVWQFASILPWLMDWGMWAFVAVGAGIALVAALGSLAANRLARV